MISKVDLNAILNSESRVVIELGCGPRKTPGRIGIDRIDLPGVDIVADLNEGLPYFPDRCVDEIHSSSVFEHIEDLPKLIHDIARVLKPNGKSYAFVPHFSNPYFYSDYTHSKFFGLYTLYYFSTTENQSVKRKCPNFYTQTRIKVHSIEYVFTSPFRGRRIFKKLIGKLFNLNTYMKELYEENFCYIFPCYGMRIVFGPDNDAKALSR